MQIWYSVKVVNFAQQALLLYNWLFKAFCINPSTYLAGDVEVSLQVPSAILHTWITTNTQPEYHQGTFPPGKTC